MTAAICTALNADADRQFAGEQIRIRGTVQGVGFRPHVWRVARECNLVGDVCNDGGGVLIRAWGETRSVTRFLERLRAEAPPLARIDTLERSPLDPVHEARDFRIAQSRSGRVHTAVAADAVSCSQCVAETVDANARRFRYPFTNCTHCGPRLSIIEEIPYDRSGTTMRTYEMCPQCAAEYRDPSDRRFHAQPIACSLCGPRAWLCGPDRVPREIEGMDAPAAVSAMLQSGHIVAIKGLGGFQLACNASDETAVARLRRLKRRERKPFALMLRDVEAVRRYCEISEDEEVLLRSPAGPIVILAAAGTGRIAASVAPGIRTLGCMLPSTPLHHLILQELEQPIVLTSGNLSEEPQCIDNAEALARLGEIADLFLLHDRRIARRLDDSVALVVGGAPRILRRARGYAPMPFKLPDGFVQTAPVLAMGAELKNTFCLVSSNEAIVSHHMGDLENAPTYDDYSRSIEQYLHLFDRIPEIIAVDLHPEYLSTKRGRRMAESFGTQIQGVQHHHAHIASCMAENGVPLAAPPLLGIALDGLGLGEDGGIWGGEFLRCDYRSFQRLASSKPVAMPGGAQCMREPWRNTYAHLVSAMGWQRFARDFSELDLHRFLRDQPRNLLDGMIARGVNSPLASSCGRLFDAVAAAAGVCREKVYYEGQAAIEFEALVDQRELSEEDDACAYPFSISPSDHGLPCIDAAPMWQALLLDLAVGTGVPQIAARFHKGLARIIARLATDLWSSHPAFVGPKTVALSGGVMQNRVLLEQLIARLQRAGFRVLTHRQVPSNDGGLALGQAVVAAARSLESRQTKRSGLCV